MEISTMDKPISIKDMVEDNSFSMEKSMLESSVVMICMAKVSCITTKVKSCIMAFGEEDRWSES
jgi:hypothetical protein